MAANTAIVNHVTGKAWVRASDGSLAEIKAGSRVPADAEIVTGPGASVQLAVPGQPAVMIGESREVTIGEDVFRPQNPAEASVVPPAGPDSARLLGEMLDDTPPVADAGQVLPGGNLNDGGGSFVRLMRVVEETTPLSLSYPRPHQDLPDTVRYPGGWGGREGNDSPQRTSLAGGGVTARGDEDGDAIAPLNMSHYFTDPDGDPLSYRATGLPPGLTIDPKTGVVSGKIDGSASQGGPGGNGEYVVKVTATDPDGKSVSHIIKWTVTNPPPEADDDAATTDEGTALNVGAAGGVLGNDADPDGDTLVVSAVDGDTGMVGKPVAGNNGGTFSINPDGSYTFDPAGQFDDLPAGQTRQTSITYTISDGEGGFDTATLTVTVQGTNDVPVVTDDARSVTEDVGVAAGMLSVDGAVTITDPDTGESVFDPATTAFGSSTHAGGQLGHLVVNPDGTYTYRVANGAVQFLKAGESIVETYTVKSADGTQTSTITITINGTNDVPVVTNDAQSVTEDAGAVGGKLSVDGAVTIDDADGGESTFDPGTTTFTGSTHAGGQLGSIVVNPDGTYTYEVDNAAVQFLKAGETIVETYTVKSADGTATSTITITINGTNDVPVVTDDAQSVTEDAGVVGGKLSVDGAVTVTDTDDGESTFDPASTTFTGTTHAGGQLGAIVVNPDGTYTYEVDNAAVQFLKAGETIVETYTVKSADGTATSTITITINGTNDVPVVTDDAQSVTEDAGAVGGKLSVDGAVTITDADNGESTFDPGTTTFTGSTHAGGQLGSIVVNPDGTYTYEVDNAAVQFLKAAESIVETYTVQSADGTATSTITITINGTNDVPVVTDDAQSVTEDAGAVGGKLSVDGAVTITDTDDGESTFDPATTAFTGTTHAGGQLGSIVVNPDGTYTYEVDNAAVQFLKAGESIVETYTVKSADGTATSTITITINGTNDVPVVTDDAQSVTEDTGVTAGMLSVDGAVTITDADTGEATFDPATTTFTGTTHAGGQLGSIVVNPDGTYTYKVANSEVQFLKAGETIVETYTVKSADGTATSTITITINGTNDVPVVTDDAQSVTEDAGVVGGKLSVDGAVTITDADDGESSFDPATTTFTGTTHGGGQLGTVVVNPNGTYTYEVDNAAVQFLKAGESIVETYTVQSADGTQTSTITITINGTNDVPVVTDDAQSVTEDAGAVGGKLSVDGAVTITDTDDGESTFDPGSTAFTGSTHPGGQLGAIVVNPDGTYTYEVDNAAVQFLKAGETIVETYTVKSADGTATSTITITINGTNDVPVVTDDAQSVTEDVDVVGGVLSVDGAVSITDADNGESVFDPATTAFTGSTHAGGQLGAIVVNPDGTYTYRVNNSAVQFLKAGETIVETYTVQSDDGTATSTITITINGTNDVPVVTDDARSVTEDAGVVGGKLSVDGVVTITDTDDGESTFDPGSTVFTGSTHAGGQLGSISVNPDGTYTYQVDNSAVQFLKEGESVVETYTVQSADGTATSTITITINGTNDAPMANVDSNLVVESGVVDGGNIPTAGQPSANGNVLDNDTDVDAGTVLQVSAISLGATVGTLGTPLQGMYGSLVLNANGSYTYILDNSLPATQNLASGATAAEHFTYTITDGDGGTATAMLTIGVTGTNDAPVITSSVAQATGAVVEQGHYVSGVDTATGTLTSSDVDAGATATWSIQGAGAGTYGNIAIDPATGTWVYTLDNGRAATQALNKNDQRTETFTAIVTDEHGATATQTIVVHVQGNNDAPQAANDSMTLDEDPAGGSVSGNVLTNDLDVDDTLTVVRFQVDGDPTQHAPGSTVNIPGVGSLLIGSDGSFTFTPLPDYSGAVPDVTYTVRESGGDSLEASAKLLLTIRPVADAPDLGAPADVGTPEDTVVALGLTAPQVTDRVDQNGAGEGDNPELLGPITLNGIPSGVQLLDGANGDAVLFTSTGGPITIVLTDPDAGNGHYTGATGTLQLTKQQYEALKILAAEHDADNFTVVVTVGSYEVDDAGVPLVGTPPANESVDVLVDVQAVTDDVALTFNDGSASKTFELNEDTIFDLSAELKAAFQDLDGSEQRSLEISGLPPGTTVFVDGSPRTVGASGSITIDAKAGANGQTGDLGSFPQIGIRPPANFSGDITDVSVTLRAQDTDADSSGAIAEKTATVDLDFYTRPVSDSVRIADTSMPEDTQATFLSSLQFIDADGSETLTGLVIQGIPAGWELRDGDGNVLMVGDGVTAYTVPAIDLDGGSASAAFRDYTLQPPAHDSRDAAITVQATTRDERVVNGVTLDDTNTHDVPVNVRVTPVAEVVTTDTDGDGQPDLTMAGGHTYGNGTAGAEDGWFALAQDGYDPGLGWNNQDGVANGGTEQTYALLTPVLTAGAAGETAIGAQFRYSTDGGATWVTLTYDGTPVEIPAEYLSTVQFMPPAHVSGSFQIEMQAHTVDTDPDTGAQVEATSGSAVLDGIVIDPVADTVTLSVGGVSGRAEGLEDTAIPLSLRPSSSDPTETFDMTISDIPPGAVLTYGGAVLTVVGGSVSIIGFDRNVPLTITPPPNSNEDFDLTITAVSVDTQGGVTDYSDPQTLTLTVDVRGVADEADILLRQDDPSIAPEDQAFAEADVEANGNAINLSDLVRGTALTDADGSEVLTLRITGLPEGFSIQGATFMGGTGLTREWVLTPAQLASARLTVPENYSGTVKGQLYAVTTENDGDSHTSADLGLTAVVTPSPESVMTISSSVVEDTRSLIDFSIASNGGDTNESLTKVWIRVDDVDGNPNFTLYLGENGPALADAGLTVVNKGGVDYYELSGAQISDIYAQASANASSSTIDPADVRFSVKYEITDQSNDGTVPATSSEFDATHELIVAPVTDPVSLTITGITATDAADGTTYVNGGVPGFNAVRGTTLEVGITLAKQPDAGGQPDHDGSEQFTRVLISGVPEGMLVDGMVIDGQQLSASYLGGDSWLIIVPDAAYSRFDGPINGAISFTLGAGMDGNLTDVPLSITVVTQDYDPAQSTGEERASANWTLTTDFDGSAPVPAASIEEWRHDDAFAATEDQPFTLGDAMIASIDDTGVLDNSFTVTLKGLPPGTEVSGMTRTLIGGEEVWTATGTGGDAELQTLLDSIVITPPENWNDNNQPGGLPFEATLTTHVPSGGRDEASATVDQPVDPVSDAAIVAITTTKGDADGVSTGEPPQEGQPVAISIDLDNPNDGAFTQMGDKLYLKVDESGLAGGELRDADGNPLVPQTLPADTLPGMPAGDYYVIDVPAGTPLPLQLAYFPPASGAYSGGSLSLQGWIQSQEQGASAPQTSTGDNTADLAVVNDGYDVSVGTPDPGNPAGNAIVAGQENSTGSDRIVLDLGGSGLVDNDGSETALVAMLKNLPNGFLVYVGNDAASAVLADNAGLVDGANTWTFNLGPGGTLPPYIAVVPPQHWSGVIPGLELAVVSGESSLDEARTDSATFDLRVDAVADGLESMNASRSFGQEGSIMALNLNAVMADAALAGTGDQSHETVTLTFKGMGEHAAFYVGTTLVDAGSVSYDAATDTYTLTGLSQSDLDDLGVIQAAGAAAGTIDVTAKTVESANGDESTEISGSFELSIRNVAPTIGNDILLYDGNPLDGRAGNDTVRLRYGEDIDFSDFGAGNANPLKNIETLDLTRDGYDHALLNLGADDVRGMTDARRVLTIDADDGDTVSFDPAGNWSRDDGLSDAQYDVYTSADDPDVKVRVTKDFDVQGLLDDASRSIAGLLGDDGQAGPAAASAPAPANAQANLDHVDGTQYNQMVNDLIQQGKQTSEV